MTERLLLVSTCGTSLLTNGASTDDRTWLTKVANAVEVDAARITPIVDDRRTRLNTAGEATRRQMSAELNGISAVLDRYRPTQIFHLLVHTDTAMVCATDPINQPRRLTSQQHHLACAVRPGRRGSPLQPREARRRPCRSRPPRPRLQCHQQQSPQRRRRLGRPTCPLRGLASESSCSCSSPSARATNETCKRSGSERPSDGTVSSGLRIREDCEGSQTERRALADADDGGAVQQPWRQARLRCICLRRWAIARMPHHTADSMPALLTRRPPPCVEASPHLFGHGPRRRRPFSQVTEMRNRTPFAPGSAYRCQSTCRCEHQVD